MVLNTTHLDDMRLVHLETGQAVTGCLHSVHVEGSEVHTMNRTLVNTR